MVLGEGLMISGIKSFHIENYPVTNMLVIEFLVSYGL